MLKIIFIFKQRYTIALAVTFLKGLSDSPRLIIFRKIYYTRLIKNPLLIEVKN